MHTPTSVNSEEALAELLTLDKTVSRVCGTIRYWLHGRLHRQYGPALIVPGVRECWYLYGYKHRIGGPAAIFYGKFSLYYLHDRRIESIDEYRLLTQDATYTIINT